MRRNANCGMDEMKINSEDFRLEPRKKIKLKDRTTIVKPFCKSKEEYREVLEDHVAKLSALQRSSGEWMPPARTALAGT